MAITAPAATSLDPLEAAIITGGNVSQASAMRRPAAELRVSEWRRPAANIATAPANAIARATHSAPSRLSKAPLTGDTSAAGTYSA